MITKRIKKNIGLSLIILALGGIFVYSLGLYPLARVNEDIIWRYVFENRVSALAQFEERNRSLAGSKELSIEEHKELKRVVLENLIVNRILVQYMKRNYTETNLFAEAEKRVEEALATADPNVLPRATSELYGWSIREFRDNVLIPQARQAVLEEQISISGKSYQAFVTEQLVASKVILYFVPWKWDKGKLIEK